MINDLNNFIIIIETEIIIRKNVYITPINPIHDYAERLH